MFNDLARGLHLAGEEPGVLLFQLVDLQVVIASFELLVVASHTRGRLVCPPDAPELQTALGLPPNSPEKSNN